MTTILYYILLVIAGLLFLGFMAFVSFYMQAWLLTELLKDADDPRMLNCQQCGAKPAVKHHLDQSMVKCSCASRTGFCKDDETAINEWNDMQMQLIMLNVTQPYYQEIYY